MKTQIQSPNSLTRWVPQSIIFNLRKWLYLFVLVAMVHRAEAQAYSSTSLTLPPSMDLIQAVQDEAGRVWVLGLFSNTVTSASSTYTSQGLRDCLLLQYAPDGALNWSATLGGPNDEIADWVHIVVRSNFCVLSGVETASLRLVDGTGTVINTPYNSGNKVGGLDGYLLKIDSAGRFQWMASLTGSSAGEGGRYAAIDSSGNVYWAGSFNGCCPSQGSVTLSDSTGAGTTLTSPSYGTGFLIKLSSSGSYIWSAKCYNRDANFNIPTTSADSGSVYVSGFSRSWSPGTATTVIDGTGASKSIANGSYQSSFVAKFNSSNGAFQWALSTQGGSDSQNFASAYALTTDPSGNLIFGGSYNTAAVSFGGQSPSLGVPNGLDGYVGCVSPDGIVRWMTQIGGTGDQLTGSISLAKGGQLLIGGRTTSGLSLSNTNIPAIGGVDGFVAELSLTNGTVVSAGLLGNSNENEVRDIQGNTTGISLVSGQTVGGFQAFGGNVANTGPFVLLPSPTPTEPLIIVTQPKGQIVSSGGSATFSVAATGSGPITYQWRRNLTDLPGATHPTLTITNAQPSQAGNYDAVVRNVYQSVTSATVRLDIIHAASATPIVANGFVIGTTLVDGGFGYTNPPLVRIIGGGGSGAQGLGVVSNGVLTAIHIINAGYGYSATPQFFIQPPIIPNPGLQIAPMTLLSFTNVTPGGSYQLQRKVAWYWTNESTTFAASTATYTQLLSGAVSAGAYRLVITPAPTQAFASLQTINGFVIGATLTAGGSGYVNPPKILISGGGGSNATAVATLNGGVVTGISITSAGIGYTNTPSIRIDPPPAAALYPSQLPVMRLRLTDLSPYDSYQLYIKPSVNLPWATVGGLMTPTTPTSTVDVMVTNRVGFFRLVYNP